VRSVLTAVLRFRLLLVGVAAGLIVVGAVTLPQMHDDVLPELATSPVLEVQTEALGLSSEEVEQYLTVPLENNLLDGIMGVWDVRSDSLPGLSSINLYFEPGTNLLNDRLLVQERLTQAFSLPNVAKPPLLIQPLSSSDRVLLVGLTSRTLNPLELSYLARWIIKPKLSGVPGVANVAIFGQQDRQIQVQVDPATLAANNVTLQQVIDTAGNAQLVSPLSYLEGSSPGTGGFIDGPNQRLDIRPILPLGTPSDLAAVPVSGAAAGVTLGDVATVVQSHQPLIGDALVHNGAGFVLEIQKLPSASVRGVTDGVLQALRELRPALRGVTIDTSFFRPASYIASSLHNLALGLIAAAALTLLALVALLIDLRTAFVGLIAVAMSLMTATLLLDALGYTLNALVILGLVIATSVVVDDAVTATHEIVGRLAQRKDSTVTTSIEASVIAAYAELWGTLGYATLVCLLVAAPVFFATGLTATFLHPMALAFALTVTASLVMAFTLTPALGVLLFDRGQPRSGPAIAGRVRSAYTRLTARALTTPRPAIIGLCVIGLAGLVAFPFLGEPSPPSFQDRNLVIAWDSPPGTSLTEMDRVTALAAGELQALPEVADVGATLGRAVSADQIVDVNAGQIYVTVKPGANYGQALAAIRAVAYGTPGMHAVVGTYEAQVMAGVLAPSADQVDVRVYGEDYGELGQLARRLAGLIARVNGVGTPRVQMPTLEPNIEVTINDAAALRAGVLPGDARREASALVSGLTVGNFFESQAVFDVVVLGAPSVRSSIDSVRNLELDTVGGGHVSLGQIGNVSVRPDPVDIEHEAASRYVDVTVPLRGLSMGSAESAIQTLLGRIRYPLEYHAEVLGSNPDNPTSHATFLSYVAAAAIAIFLLFQAALGSWRLAALLLALLPLALLGGLAVALASGEASALGTDAGLVAVLALAVRQGLALLAHIRRRQAGDGGELTPELVVRASAERLRTTVAAAFVLAAVLLPFVVLGNVAGNEMTHTAAAVILGGLVTATVLSLFVLPAACLALGSTTPIPIEEPEDAPDRPRPARRRS